MSRAMLLLDVQNLGRHARPAARSPQPARRIPDPPRHAASRSTTSPSTIAPGEILGVVGESGAGKSLTGAAIIGLLEPPGRIAGGEIRFDGQRIDNLPYDEMRQMRGRTIGAIFQDPLTSLNPLYTIGRQLIETIQTHLPVERRRGARSARCGCCRRPASRPPRSASTSTRTSSPAACASAS